MKNEKPAKAGSVTEAVPSSHPSPHPSADPNPYPNVDRLIELPSDKTPAGLAAPADRDDPGAGEAPENSPKPSDDKPVWKILLQLKPFLPYIPYIARLVPLLDVALGPVQNAALSNEVRQAIAQSVVKIQTIQRDVSTAVQDQAVQMARIEEEITRLRQASEKYAEAQAHIAEELGTLGTLIRLSAAGLAILLIALIVMTGVLLAHMAH